MTGLIDIEIYCRNIIVHFGGKKSLKKALRQYHNKDTVDYILNTVAFESKGYTLYDSIRQVFILYMPKIPQTAEDMAFLSHEIFHVANAIMENVGSELTDSSEEAYAYLIGYLTKKILETFSISISV